MPNEVRKYKTAVVILSVAVVVLVFLAGFSIAKAETLDRDRGLAKMADRVRDAEYRLGAVEREFENHDDYGHVDHGDIQDLRGEMEKYGDTYYDRLRENENKVRWLIRVLVFNQTVPPRWDE